MERKKKDKKIVTKRESVKGMRNPCEAQYLLSKKLDVSRKQSIKI